MGPFEMVVGIVLIVTIGSIVRAKHGIRRDNRGNEYSLHDEATRAENRQLREELRGMKERLAVLERLATDDNRSLDREIEKLRDRNSDRV